MWTSLTPLLICPLCCGKLVLSPLEPGSSAGTPAWIDTALLLCVGCKTRFPIFHGVPLLLPYVTPAHQEFERTHLDRLGAANGFAWPACEPVPGERLVMQSFSTEWLDYEFDGVIWEMDYADHERRFLTELGPYAPAKANGHGRFLEIGCGIGLTTAMAQKNFGGEAIGVDLSLAAWRAAARNRSNPHLHFVQASVFALPFAPETFDTIYTRGVLHHTYSTRKAFAALAPMCRPGGSVYVWVYGTKSINDNLFRRMVYAVEVVMRFILNRTPSWLSAAALAPFALSYVLFNRSRRLGNSRIQPYNFQRGLHAARDRFTPEFAHRQDADEVLGWFREAGYTDLEAVDWRTMPSADHDDYRRNTGVRGRRAPVR